MFIDSGQAFDIPLEEVSMGEVVFLGSARPVEDSTGDFLDSAYAAMERLPSFKARPGQRELSRAILEALLSRTPLAAEAPTGTGKTLAYLLAALAAHQSLPEPLPIIIATATVGLQHQIITGDLPKLDRAKLLSGPDVALAKGRGRYFCVLSAERVVSGAEDAGQLDFFDLKAGEAVDAMEVAERLLEQFHGGAWEGDLDLLPGAPPSPEAWAYLHASPDTCLRRRCEYFERCPFFKERARLAHAKVIVANQDLVLSDLRMAKEGEQDPLFPFPQYLLVIDEAHNLPHKALDVGSAKVELEAAQLAISSLPAVAGKFFREPELAKLLEGRSISPSDFEPGPALLALGRAAAQIRLCEPTEPGDTVVRLGRALLPDALARAVIEVRDRLSSIDKAFEQSLDVLRNSKLPDRVPHLAPVFSETLFLASFFGSRLRRILAAVEMFLQEGKSVRWLDHDATRAALHVSPLEGADVLRPLLWESERAIPVLVSATLKAFGTFDRFAARSGLPQRAKTYTSDPIFAYENSQFVIAKLQHTPRQSEREKYEAEVESVLPKFVRQGEATLVLFPSQRLMRRAVGALRARFDRAVLVQGEIPFSTLLRTHRARTDAGQTSVLCGLATLAEGLDLPGKYCVHVIIAALPFPVPTSPVELEIRSELGDRYFQERALPDAMMRLIQMVGRLIRREGDCGRITILDKRLGTTRWGWDIVKNLPPFTRRMERPGDRAP